MIKKVLGNCLFYGITLALLFVLIAQLGFLPFRLMYVRTGSMAPDFYPGDLAFVRLQNTANVHPGQVVMFYMGGEPVLHRVLRIENGQIITKGDANTAEDVQPLQKVDGRLLFTLPKLGYAVAALQSLFGPRG